jgi:hypothetical protein
LIDKKTGTSRLSGWDIDIEDKIIVNYEDISATVPYWNSLKYRTWSFYLLYTEEHVI